MRWCFTILLLTTSIRLVAADTPKIAKELEPFQGMWSIEAITRDGVAVPKDAVQQLILVVKGNERLVKDGDDVKSKGTYTVDATKTPKQMDVTVADGPLAGKTLRGIYELKDDTFTLCLMLEGDTRPEDFTCKEGSNRLLQVFKKSKAAAVKEPELRTELLARRKADQGTRLKYLEILRKTGGKPEGDNAEQLQALVAKIHEQDSKNGDWLKGIIKKHGWPGIALVGKDGAEAAFILAQHAGQDAEFQKKCLELLTAAVKAKDASAIHMAHLTDRVKVAAGEKQVYGTEVTEQDGTLVAVSIEDEAKVDERRKSVGLPALADALQQARRERGLPEKK
jgi:uncharacterized protein (TIGR03067 family)